VGGWGHGDRGLKIAHELVNAFLVLGLTKGGQMSINDRGNGAAMSEVNLELAEVFPLLQQVRGVRVAQRMDMGVLGDATGLEGDAEGALKGGAADRLLGRGSTEAPTSLGGKEQSSMAMGFPLLAQQLKRALRQRDVTVLISFAAANVQEHALGIDVANLEAQCFSQTKTTRINGRQTDPVIQSFDQA